jgi:hypothetical protein
MKNTCIREIMSKRLQSEIHEREEKIINRLQNFIKLAS